MCGTGDCLLAFCHQNDSPCINPDLADVQRSMFNLG